MHAKIISNMKSILTHVQRVRLLYKTILKMHRGLPPDLQVMGNIYVQDEFRRHKNCSSQEANIFMNEWTSYALNIAEQLGLRGPKTSQPKYGAHLTTDILDEFKDDQILQLHELMKAAKNISQENNQDVN